MAVKAAQHVGAASLLSARFDVHTQGLPQGLLLEQNPPFCRCFCLLVEERFFFMFNHRTDRISASP